MHRCPCQTRASAQARNFHMRVKAYNYSSTNRVGQINIYALLTQSRTEQTTHKNFIERERERPREQFGVEITVESTARFSISRSPGDYKWIWTRCCHRLPSTFVWGQTRRVSLSNWVIKSCSVSHRKCCVLTAGNQRTICRVSTFSKA